MNGSVQQGVADPVNNQVRQFRVEHSPRPSKGGKLHRQHHGQPGSVPKECNDDKSNNIWLSWQKLHRKVGAHGRATTREKTMSPMTQIRTRQQVSISALTQPIVSRVSPMMWLETT